MSIKNLKLYQFKVYLDTGTRAERNYCLNYLCLRRLPHLSFLSFSLFILIRLLLDDKNVPGVHFCAIPVPPGSRIADISGAIAVQLCQQPGQDDVDVVDEVVQVFKHGQPLSPADTLETCGIAFDDVLGFRTHQRLYLER